MTLWDFFTVDHPSVVFFDAPEPIQLQMRRNGLHPASYRAALTDAPHNYRLRLLEDEAFVDHRHIQVRLGIGRSDRRGVSRARL